MAANKMKTKSSWGKVKNQKMQSLADKMSASVSANFLEPCPIIVAPRWKWRRGVSDKSPCHETAQTSVNYMWKAEGVQSWWSLGGRASRLPVGLNIYPSLALGCLLFIHRCKMSWPFSIEAFHCICQEQTQQTHGGQKCWRTPPPQTQRVGDVP